ncbi:hypothetical protein [Paraburkholderia youngii]|uniref:hypothetical protein n=1 Tax=Paraburkholderia youngii TaxID=2782701 RepID=UPI003D2074B4
MLALKDQLRVIEALRTGVAAGRTYTDVLFLIGLKEIGGDSAHWEQIQTTYSDGDVPLWLKQLGDLMDPHVAVLVRLGINLNAGQLNLSPAARFVHLLMRHDGLGQFQRNAATLKGELATLEALKLCGRTGAYEQCFDLLAEYKILGHTEPWQTAARALRGDRVSAAILVQFTTPLLSAPVGQLLSDGAQFSFGGGEEAFDPAIDYLHTAIQRAAFVNDREPAAA